MFQIRTFSKFSTSSFSRRNFESKTWTAAAATTFLTRFFTESCLHDNLINFSSLTSCVIIALRRYHFVTENKFSLHFPFVRSFVDEIEESTDHFELRELVLFSSVSNDCEIREWWLHSILFRVVVSRACEIHFLSESLSNWYRISPAGVIYLYCCHSVWYMWISKQLSNTMYSTFCLLISHYSLLLWNSCRTLFLIASLIAIFCRIYDSTD